MKMFRNLSIFVLTFLSILVVGLYGCQKEAISGSNSSIYPDVEIRDAIPKNNLVIQFQYNKIYYSSKWVENAEPTKADGLAMLDAAYNSMSKTEKTNFKCVYLQQQNFIKNTAALSSVFTNSKYVSGCCPDCVKVLGKDNGARCDLNLYRGKAFSQ